MNADEAITYLTIAYVAQQKAWYAKYPEYTMPDYANLDEDDEPNWYEFAQINEVNISDVVVKRVEKEGGGEGSGEHMHMVFSFTFPDGQVEYWRKDGYYASYDGGYWDGDFSKVNLVQRIVTFYE